MLLILGLSALRSRRSSSRNASCGADVPLMVVASVAVLAMATDGAIGRLDGLVLIAGLVGWIGWSILEGQAQRHGIGLAGRAE